MFSGNNDDTQAVTQGGGGHPSSGTPRKKDNTLSLQRTFSFAPDTQPEPEQSVHTTSRDTFSLIVCEAK